METPEEAIRAAAEHVERLRTSLAAGRGEIERQRASIDETRDHLNGMSRWIQQTDRLLGEERSRRASDGLTPSDE